MRSARRWLPGTHPGKVDGAAARPHARKQAPGTAGARTRISVLRGGLAGTALLLCAPLCPAAEWFVEPLLRVATTYNDNFRLTSASEQEAYLGVVDLRAAIGRRTETSEFTLTPQASFLRFNDGTLDTEDQSLKLASYLETERSRFALDGAFVRDTSLTGDPDEPFGDGELIGSGVVQRRVRRETLNLKPSWTYAITERDDVTLGFEHTDVSYDQGNQLGLVDYDYNTVSVAGVHALSEVDRVSATAIASRFEAGQVRASSTDYGVLIGYERDFTETLTASAAAGLRQTRVRSASTGVPSKSDDTGLLVNLGLSKRLERGTLDLTYNRSISPTGTGSVVERDALSANITHRFTQRLTGVLSGDLLWDDDTSGQNSSLQRQLSRLRARLQWRWTRELSLVGAYRYTRQEREARGTEADSHAFTVSVVYRVPRIVFAH